MTESVTREGPTPPSPRQRLVASFSWVVAANLARQIAFLVVNVVLYERLSRGGFGAIALAFGYMQIFAGLGEFGIRQIGWREVARHPERAVELTGSFLAAKNVTVTLSVVLYLALFPWLWSDPDTRWVYLAYGLGVAFNGGTFDFPFFGLQRIDLFAKYSLIAFGLYLAGCLLLVHEDRWAWLVPVLFASSMAVLFALELRWFLRTKGPFRLRLQPDTLVRILRQSWPLGVGETLNRLALGYPILLIGMAVGSEGVGNYRIAELCYSFLAQFGHMYASAVFSHLSRVFHHRRAELPRTLVRMLLPMVVGALVFGGGVLALGPTVYRLGFDQVSPETLSVLRILGVTILFAAPVRFLKALLPSIDQQRMVPVVNAVSLALGAGVGWLLLQSRGIAGMAQAVAAAEAVTLVLLLAVFWRSLGSGPEPAQEIRKAPR